MPALHHDDHHSEMQPDQITNTTHAEQDNNNPKAKAATNTEGESSNLLYYDRLASQATRACDKNKLEIERACESSGGVSADIQVGIKVPDAVILEKATPPKESSQSELCSDANPLVASIQESNSEGDAGNSQGSDESPLSSSCEGNLRGAPENTGKSIR